MQNWRWHGVPFYLRSGKAMKASRQTVTLGFDTPPVRMFRAHRHDVPAGRGNEIIIDFADPGSMSKTRFRVVRSGAELRLDGARPDAYRAFENVGRAYLHFARNEPAYYSAMFEAASPSTAIPPCERRRIAPSRCCAMRPKHCAAACRATNARRP